MTSHSETATLAGGCFWCLEALFKRLRGVISVQSGYTGGTKQNPTYDDVCSGKTGHAEAIQITFDPDVISYETILTIFWHMHDPTTINQQGNDVGTQYRSVIFYHDQDQYRTATALKEELEHEHTWKSPIVTEILPSQPFYPAEDYHTNYYDKNSYQPYCQYTIDPKVQKLLKEYSSLVKREYK
jgi:peptide-methionine (S)-S-oxide reductase